MTNAVLNPGPWLCLEPGELVLFQAGATLYPSVVALRYSEHNDPHVKFPEIWDGVSVEAETLCPTPVLILKQHFRRGQSAPRVLGYEVLVDDLPGLAKVWFINASVAYKRIK